MFASLVQMAFTSHELSTILEKSAYKKIKNCLKKNNKLKILLLM